MCSICRVSTDRFLLSFSFFFNDTATTEIYTLFLHDALPISRRRRRRQRRPLLRGLGGGRDPAAAPAARVAARRPGHPGDRKSTRLNSSHANISYAVFCLKKKKTHNSTSCSCHPTRHPITSEL